MQKIVRAEISRWSTNRRDIFFIIGIMPRGTDEQTDARQMLYAYHVMVSVTIWNAVQWIIIVL